MPFPTQIQPIDAVGAIRIDKSKQKSMLKRLFTSVRRSSSSEKLDSAGDIKEVPITSGGDNFADPSSVALDKMVRCYLEHNSNGRGNRYNCFHGACDNLSDVDDLATSRNCTSVSDAGDLLKGLVVCSSSTEWNLTADTNSTMEMFVNVKSKEELRRMLVKNLKLIGYDAEICTSKWDKSPTYPAGKHEYIDVMVEETRLLIEIDFRSEFEIARSTKRYKALLQLMPTIYIGTPDRLEKIVNLMSEAAKQSLKKKGLHMAPWRKSKYMCAKWLSTPERAICEANRVEIEVASLD